MEDVKNSFSPRLQAGTSRFLLKERSIQEQKVESNFLCCFSNVLKSKTGTNINILMHLLVLQLILGSNLLHFSLSQLTFYSLS